MQIKTFASHVSEFLQCAPGTELSESAARYLLGSIDYHEGKRPYELVDIALQDALSRYSVEVKNIDSTQSSRLGRLYTRLGGFLLKIRRDIRESTYRFVKAHELAHTLAYDRLGAEPRRYFSNSPSEEKICNAIARHLLLPKEMRSKTHPGPLLLSPVFLNASKFSDLAKDYRVHPWQIVRLEFEVKQSDTDSLVAILWRQETESVLHVVDCISPQGIYIPIGDRCFKGNRDNQGVWKGTEESEVHMDYEYITLGSLTGKLQSVSFRVPETGHSIIQILKLDQLHLARASKWKSDRKIRY